MSLPKYPRYKASGQDWPREIPASWTMPPLYLRYSVELGKMLDTAKQTGRYRTPYLRNVDVQWGSINLADLPTMDIGPEEMDRYSVREGDLLVCEGGEVGRCAVVRELTGTLGFQKALHRLRALNADESPSYMEYVLRAAADRGAFNGEGQSTIAHLTGEQFRKYRFPKPPLADQVLVVAFLDRETAKIDVLIAEQEKLIALLAEKRQATISLAVTRGLNPKVPMKDSGVAWLGEVPAHWDIKRFRDACTAISTGPFGTALGSDDYINEGVPVINPSHIGDGKLVPDEGVSVANETAERLSFWTLRAGDIVVARRGELGRAAVVTSTSDGWICGTGSLRVTPNASQATADFLRTVLQATYAREWLNQASVGSTMANLNEGILGSLPIALPRELGEQMQLTNTLYEKLSEIEETTLLAQESVALLHERRSALITAAVTGQIDVRNAVPHPATEPEPQAA